ncbi:MAG TPA: glutamate--cysteine ligase, partial [Segeticoccus sp.]|nr:glutamate--cysteine ligase [Segeticoccus sp.]
VSADELVLRHLLPLARQGLEDWGVSGTVCDRYLGIIEQRCTSGVNGASWQVDAVARLEERGLDRREALREMLRHYVEGMHSNEPVHTWPLP